MFREQGLRGVFKSNNGIIFYMDTVRTIQCKYEFPLYNTKEQVMQIMLEKSLLNKKSCIGTKYLPLTVKCFSIKMKNYHPGLL